MSIVNVSTEEITELLPHREPFIFVDRVTELEAGKRILAERELRADEPFFKGHFPGRPIMPGVLITEALAQTSGLLLALTALENRDSSMAKLFYLARADMKWTTPCVPGDTLILESKLVRNLEDLVAFRVRAYKSRADVASGGLTLARVKQSM